MEKMTKAEMLLEAAVVLGGMNETGQYGDIIEMLELEAARVEKRNASRRGTETKEQKANKHLAALVIEFFLNEADEDVAYSAQEIAEAIGAEDVSSQKMTAILKIVGDEVEKVDKSTNNKARKGYKKAV